MTRKVCFQIKICEIKPFTCALHLFVGHHKHFEYGYLSIFYDPHILLTVTNKLLHLENHFVDVSTVLHKMHYNIS